MKVLKNAISLITLSLFFSIPTFSQDTESKGYQFTQKILLDNTEVKNQQQTGTCWSYCTTSFIESELLRMGKPSIDLSEMYNVRMVYEDKAMNYVLRQGKAQFGEGGLSHDVMSSIQKYGLVPESAYSGNMYNPGKHNHSEMVAILEAQLETIITNPNRKLSPFWPQNISNTLNTYLGEIPVEFKYEGKSYTPNSFSEYLEINPNNYATFTSFTNAPFYSSYVLQVPDNWANGSFINLPLTELMAVIDNALNNGFTIAWDADVSEGTWSRKNSIAILPEVPYLEMSKQERSKLFKNIVPEMDVNQDNRQESFMNYETTDDHLMHIIGTAVDQNNNEYYIVKNSWGTKHKYDGYVYVSKPYMAMKTIGIMIHKDAIPKNISNKLSL